MPEEVNEQPEGAKPRRRQPRKLSPRYLENAALFHLKRYSCSSHQLRTVLRRKARRSLRAHGGDEAEASGWIEELLQRLVRSGLLNDESFARNRAQSLRAAGKSQRAIALKLRQKGLTADLVQRHVQEALGQLSEVDAAWVLARKRRLGPFRQDAGARKERRMKDLAALARAGFSYDVARAVVDGALEERPPR